MLPFRNVGGQLVWFSGSNELIAKIWEVLASVSFWLPIMPFIA